MKNIFIVNHNRILSDLEKDTKKHSWEDKKSNLNLVGTIEEADVIVMWGDTTSLERGIVNYARTLKKPVIVAQHGRKGTSRYFPPINDPITADKLLVWGIRDKNALVKVGHPEDKIEITGTSIFSHLKGRKKHEGINVVFCPEHWDREISENRKVASILNKLKGVKITTKLIEGHDEKLYKNPVISNRNHENHLEICADVLSTADLVVGISESTFELMAQYLDIPVVIMEEWYPKTFGGDEKYYSYRRIRKSKIINTKRCACYLIASLERTSVTHTTQVCVFHGVHASGSEPLKSCHRTRASPAQEVK